MVQTARGLQPVAAGGSSAGGFRLLKIGLAVGTAMLLPTAAPAQVAPPAAPTREEVERQVPQRIDPVGPRLEVEGGVERAPCALDRPEYRDIRFTLNNVVFDNLRGLPSEALSAAYAPYVGREHPVAVICEIRDRAATILRDAGRAERLIADYLGRLTEREVFNRYEAERYLLLAGDLPGYNVRLALRSAGAARGEVIGEVTVIRTPALVDFTVQNYGSRELGRWGGLLRGQV